MTALQQQLVTAIFQRFPDLFPIGGHIGNVRFRVTGDAVKVTELAIGDAHVSGVYITVDLPGYFSMRHLFFSQLVGYKHQVGKWRMVIEINAFIR